MRRHKPKGVEAFDAWYSEHWGERWDSLREALVRPVSHVAWWNPWSDANPKDILPEDAQPSLVLPGCYEADDLPPPPHDQSGLSCYYLLDGASAMLSRVLSLDDASDVLDLCAAPGGKTLQMAAQLSSTATLTTNELSKDRFHRLQRVLHDYLPGPMLARQIRLTRYDARKWCLYEKEAYDWIVLDAPCSSERHLLHLPKEMAQWTPARSRQLAQRQYTMLVSALDVVREGGTIVYATCSISPLECDGVLDKLYKKRRGRFESVTVDLPRSEITEHGYYYLPDSSAWGPLYLSVLRKCATS